MQVEFVGAPPQYCFEQYEVRLLDDSGMELLHSGIVTRAEMKHEQIANSNVYFGEYNFTNLEVLNLSILSFKTNLDWSKLYSFRNPCRKSV